LAPMWGRQSQVGSLLVLVVVGVATTSASASGQASSSFSFSLQGSSLTQCWFYAVGFTAAEGEKFLVVWNETNFPPVSMNFYIIPQSSLREIWDCLDGPVTLYSNDGAIGSATWVAPSEGSYVVLLVNYSYSSVSGAVSIAAVNATISATPIGYGAVWPYRCRSPDPIICLWPP
jgi:CubicO group peptidase (beta-lactamase class C family)